MSITTLKGVLTDLGSCDFTNMDRQWWDRSVSVNQSLFNPEWIYGVSIHVTEGLCHEERK